MSKRKRPTDRPTQTPVLAPLGVREDTPAETPESEPLPVVTLDPETLDPESSADSSETGDTGLDESSKDETNVAPSKGRPRGAKNRNYDSGERVPAMCRKCKCTEAMSESKRVLPLPNDPDYTHIALIRCKCKKCGQWRVDRQKCNPVKRASRK